MGSRARLRAARSNRTKGARLGLFRYLCWHAVESPLVPPYVENNLPVHVWGDWGTDRSHWTSVTFTDGSGLAPVWRELRRRGWAFTQLGDNGILV